MRTFHIGKAALAAILFYFISSSAIAQSLCNGVAISPPCIVPFAGGLSPCIVGQNQGICMNGNDSISMTNSCTGTADSFVIVWPFGIPATQSFSGNYRGCLKRKVPINPDTCVHSGYIPIGVYSAFFQSCSGVMKKVGEACYTFALYPRPRPEFHCQDSACITAAYHFQNDCPMDPNIVSYHYDFGDPARTDDTADVVSPSYTYQNPGTYIVTCTATNVICNESLPYHRTVNVLPRASLDTILNMPDTVCSGVPVNPSVVATGAVTYITYAGSGYTVQNGSTSTPVITFTRTGLVSVTFNITGCCSSNSCTRTKTVIVSPGPSLSHSPIPDGCAGGGYKFIPSIYFTTSNSTQVNHITVGSATMPGIYSYNSTGIPSDTVPLATAGDYFVEVQASSGCGTADYRDTFTLTPYSPQSFPPDTVCLQSVVHLPYVAGDRVYLDGSLLTDSAIYIDSARSYAFVYQAACGTDTLHILARGVKVHASDYQSCFNTDTIPLTADRAGAVFSGGGVSGSYYISPHTQGHYPYYTTYTDPVSLCSYIDTSYIDIGAALSTSYTIPDTACTGTGFTFTNSSANTAHVDFGDHAGYHTITGSYAYPGYTQAGIEHITVLFQSSAGCTDSIRDSIMVLPSPVAFFTIRYDTLCAGEQQIIDSVSPSAGSGQWLLNGVAVSPTSIVGTNSGYTIVNDTLLYRVSTASCGVIEYSSIFCVRPRPFAHLGLIYHTYCSPAPMQYVNNSHAIDATYRWYRNGALFSTDSLPVIDTLSAHSRDSIYIVTMTATNVCGSDTFADTITIHSVDFTACFDPLSDFRFCQNTPIHFKSCVGPGCILYYDFGDSTFAAGHSDTIIDHRYKYDGIHIIHLTVDNGCRVDTMSQQITIRPAPVVSAEPDVPSGHCTGADVDFAATVAVVQPGTFYWSFGDGGYDSASQYPVHSYAAAGAYQGWLVVTGVNSCGSDTAYFSVSIDGTPVADIVTTDAAVCTGHTLQIAVAQPDTTVTYDWYDMLHGDSSITTTHDGRYTFRGDTPGVHTVLLVAHNTVNPLCSSTSAAIEVNVIQSPRADFVVDVLESNDTTTTDSMVNLSKNADSYIWDLGRGDTVYTYAPVRVYDNIGYYLVVLTAIHDICMDTMSHVVIAPPARKPYVPTAFTPNGDGINDFFQLYGPLEAMDYLSFRIFDRWGEKVFDASDPLFKWDGTYNGVLLSPAVYVYYLEFSYIGNEQVRKYKGSVVLLR